MCVSIQRFGDNNWQARCRSLKVTIYFKELGEERRLCGTLYKLPSELYVRGHIGKSYSKTHTNYRNKSSARST